MIYGLVLGLVGCFVCSLTHIWNNGFKRAAAVLFCGLAIMWLGLKLSYLGASSVGCLSLAVMVSIAWERGFPPRISKGPAFCHDLPCSTLITSNSTEPNGQNTEHCWYTPPLDKLGSLQVV